MPCSIPKAAGLITAAFGGVITCYFAYKRCDMQMINNAGMPINNIEPKETAAAEKKAPEEIAEQTAKSGETSEEFIS